MRGKALLMITVILFFCLGTASAEVPAFDLGGQTVRINHFFASWETGPDNLVFHEAEGRALARIQEVEELFNTRLEIEPNIIGLDEYTSAIMAGDVPAHVNTQNNVFELPHFIVEGLVLPLDDHLDDDYWNSLPPMLQFEPAPVGGLNYGFWAVNDYTHTMLMAWNKELFEREGLPNLYDLYEQGEWTWEAMREIVEDATRDTTGDGEVDQYGFVPYHNTQYIHDIFPYTNNAMFVEDRDGTMVFTGDSPEVIEALEFWQELLEMQGLIRDGLGTLWSTPQDVGFMDVVADGRAGLYLCYADQMHWVIEDEGREYGFVPLPMGPNADEPPFPHTEQWLGVIPVNTDVEPRALVEIINALYDLTDPHFDCPGQWMDDYLERHAMYMVDRESVEIYREMLHNMQHTNHMMTTYVYDFGLWDALTAIVAGEYPYTAIAGVRDAIQIELDEALEQ